MPANTEGAIHTDAVAANVTAADDDATVAVVAAAVLYSCAIVVAVVAELLLLHGAVAVAHCCTLTVELQLEHHTEATQLHSK